MNSRHDDVCFEFLQVLSVAPSLQAVNLDRELPSYFFKFLESGTKSISTLYNCNFRYLQLVSKPALLLVPC
jgi:hypothetical protein